MSVYQAATASLRRFGTQHHFRHQPAAVVSLLFIANLVALSSRKSVCEGEGEQQASPTPPQALLKTAPRLASPIQGTGADPPTDTKCEVLPVDTCDVFSAWEALWERDEINQSKSSDDKCEISIPTSTPHVQVDPPAYRIDRGDGDEPPVNRKTLGVPML